MRVEFRMEEFEKVSHKGTAQDVTERMAEFEVVDKVAKYPSKEKSGTLPYGVKRFKMCAQCGEIMEIHELDEKEVTYCCKSCGQRMVLEINEYNA